MEDYDARSAKNYNRYFIYSHEQMKLRREIENKLGRDLVLGTVIVKGEKKNYTEIVTDLSNVRYADAEIVTYGDIRNINYTETK